METSATGTHQSLMDGVYRHQRRVYDATRKYYLLGRDHLLSELNPAPDETALEIACGTGRNLICAAKLYPNARFYGLDLSTEKLKTAKVSIQKSRLEDSIQLAEADATDFDPGVLFGVEKFDHIFISYSLSMIPAWQACLSSAVSHLNRGGALHVVDFGEQDQLPAWFGTLLETWLKKFHVSPRADIEDAMRHISERFGAKLEFKPLYRDYARYGVIRL